MNTRKFLEVMDMFTTLVLVMASGMYAYVKFFRMYTLSVCNLKASTILQLSKKGGVLKEIKPLVQKDICTLKFTTALSTIAKTQYNLNV